MAFISGSTSYKHESITLHECSEYHKLATNFIKRSGALTLLRTLNKGATDKLMLMFRTVHALGKHNRPLTDFLWLCSLDEAKGLAVGQTYCNDMKAAEFMSYIAFAAFQDLKKTTDKL